MINRLIFILLCILYGIDIYAQQDPQFAHNTATPGFVNPGQSGMNNEICARLINRQQWVGFEGAPSITMATISTDFKLFGRKHGAGLSLLNDEHGFEKKFQAKLAYSAHLQVFGGKLGAGIEFGLMNFNLGGEFKPPQASPEQDPLIPETEVRKMIFDIGLGAFYQAGDLFAGISVAHLNQPKIAYPSTESSFLKRHFYGIIGYNFRLLSSPLELTPSVFVKSDGVKTAQDYNITGTYNKKFYIGVTYRNQDAIIPMIGFKLFSGITVGYAYELTLSKLRTANSGSHEFLVGYCFDLFKPQLNYKYKSVRFL